MESITEENGPSERFNTTEKPFLMCDIQGRYSINFMVHLYNLRIHNVMHHAALGHKSYIPRKLYMYFSYHRIHVIKVLEHYVKYTALYRYICQRDLVVKTNANLIILISAHQLNLL